MSEKIGKWLDAAGVTASWACAIHCLALTFLIGVLPFLGLSFLLDETTEQIFIGISVVFAICSLIPAYFRDHRKLRAVFLATGGIGLIALTHLLFEENLTLKFTFLLAGAGLISAAHFVNRRLCRACAVCRT